MPIAQHTLSRIAFAWLAACGTESSLRGPDRPLEAEHEPDAGPPAVTCAATPSRPASAYDPVELTVESDRDLFSVDWALDTAPAGSRAAILDTDGVHTIESDLPGTYMATAVATDTWGRSATPCTVEFLAEAPPGVWIDAHWTHAGDDASLHLTLPSSDLGGRGDCTASTCADGLDWGPPGGEGDPTMVVVGDGDAGPQAIHIEAPAGGRYDIVVHDGTGATRLAANDATVRVYVDGVRVFRDTVRLRYEGDAFHVGQLVLPDGRVEPYR